METQTLDIEKLAKDFDTKTAEQVLEWALNEFGTDIALASSFGLEDVACIDLMCKVNKAKTRIFTLDTGRLNPETYEVMERIRERYQIDFEVYFPNTDKAEQLTRGKGFFSFYTSIENRKECCGIRKVEPLKRALSHYKGWITGLRREQAVTRASLPKIELDPAFGNIIKFNPIADWTEKQTWDYVKKNDVPYNRLHDMGYPSIGCAPCTRAIKPGEDVRAGRWWWENPDSKECGLHVKQH